MNCYHPYLKKDIIRELRKKNKLHFVKTDTGKRWHIIISNKNILYCKKSSRYKMVYKKEMYDDVEDVCEDCIINLRCVYINNINLVINDPYICLWRCSQKVKNRKCKNNTDDNAPFCKNHTKSIIKILYKHTPFPVDVMNIVYDML